MHRGGSDLFFAAVPSEYAGRLGLAAAARCSPAAESTPGCSCGSDDGEHRRRQARGRRRTNAENQGSISLGSLGSSN